MTMLSIWPDFFPDDVPPEEATDASGVAYRIVSNLPPEEEDFRSTIETQPSRSFTDKERWKACGISFHRNLACSQRTRNRFPPLRSCRIAVGTLLPRHGKQLPTPTNGNSHITVWKYIQATMRLDFVEDGEQ